MRRIFKTQEIFDKEPEIIEKGTTMLKEPGVKQRKRGIGETPTYKTPKPISIENLTLVSLPPDTELDILDEKIEKVYTEYLKLHDKIEGFDTTLEGVPPAVQPSIVANYNKMIEKHNSLLGELQTNIAKRNQIVSIQESTRKKQEFIKQKHLTEEKVERGKTIKFGTKETGWEQRMRMGEIPEYKLSTFVSKADESGIKDTMDALIMGGNRIWQQTKNYFKNVLPHMIFAPIKKGQFAGMDMPEYIREEINADRRKKLEKYDEGYFRSQANNLKWIAEHPEMQPRKEWEGGVIASVKRDPTVLLKPAFYAYTAADSAAFTFGVMGTTLGITALTGNPLVGMAAGVAVAIPFQTQDLYEDFINSGGTDEQAKYLVPFMGAAIAAVEVMGDLPILASVSKPFKKLLFKNIQSKIVTRVATWAMKSKATKFVSMEVSETLEEIVQAALQDACVMTVDENRKFLGDLAEIAAATPIATLPFALFGISVDINTQNKAKALLTDRINKLINDRDLRDAIKIQLEEQGFIEKEPEVVTEAYKAEPKELTTPEELEAKREVLREHGVKEDLLTDEFVKKAKITELPKADVTSEFVSEKLIEELEKKWGKETKLTKKEVLEKVEKPPKVEPEKLGEKFVGKAFRAETTIPEHGAEVIAKMKTAQEKLDYDYGTTGNEIFKNAKKIAEELGIDMKKVPIKELTWVAPDLKTAEKYGEAEEIKLTEDTIILAKDEEGGFLVLKNADEYMKVEPKAPIEIEVGKEAKGKIEISHLSTEKKLKTVDPEFMGKGEAGREMARVGEEGFEKTSAWYTEETPNIEARFKHGMMLYTAEIDAKDIYDRKADPENLDTHTKIKEAGYKGYKIDDQIRLFEEVAVVSEGTPRAKLGEKVSIKDIKTFIKPPIRVKEASQTIGQIYKDNEKKGKPGASFSLYDGNPEGQPKFAVGTHPEVTAKIPGKNLTNTQIRNFIEDNMDLLKNPKNFFGAWYNGDTNEVVLDVSEAIESKKEAIRLGEKYKQEEIWDLEKGEGIPIKPPVPPKKTTLEQPEPEPEFDKDIKIGDVYTVGEKTPAKKVKGKVREITGQTKKDKILIAELDILDLVLKGQEKAARKAFSKGKKEGIFKQKEHFKDIVNRAKERKAQKEYINKLIKDINKLPTTNIAIDYKDKIEAIKSMFDLKKRQKKTLHAREETAKFIEKEMEKGDTVLDIPQKTLDIIKTVPLNDMTIAQLETVHDSIIHLAKIGKLKGKMIKVQKGKETEELARDLIATLYENKVNKISQEKYKLDFKELNRTQKQNIMEDFQKRTRNIKQEIRDITGLKKKISDPWNRYWVNSTLDESLFEKMDGEERGLWWEVFYNTINKCTNTELLNTFDKIEKVRNLFDDNKIDINKFLEERTGDLMLTHSQRTGLYLCSLDEDAKKHIQKAGVIIKKGLEPYQFTDSDIKNVTDSLTKEEKAVAKLYQEYQLTQEKELDEFDVRVRGVHLKGIKNRFAIQVLGEDLYNDVAVELERNPLTRRAYMEEGFRKPRAHTGEGIIMLDCVTNMMRDITKVEHYKAYKEAEMDINNLLSNPELKKAILGNPKYGRAAYDNITQWFKDSVQAKQNKILSTSDKTFMFLRTSAFISMLGFNVLSGTKQLVSLCNAVGLVGLPAVLSGIEQVSLHYNETKQFVFKRDPQARARKGMIDKVMQEWMESADAKAVLKNQTKDWRMKTLFLIRMLDEYAVLSVWKGTYDSVISSQKINGKPIKFTDAADLERQAIEYAAYAIRKTQPSALMKDLPQWFRDGTVVKLFNLFQNQINKNQNFIRDTLRQWRAGKISTGTLAWRTLWNLFLPALLIGTITRGRPPEDWKELARDIATFYTGGLFFIGSIVINAMQGYGGWMPAPLAFGEEFVKAYTYKTMESKFKHAISGICKVMGLPYNQPYRTINGVEDWIKGETEDARRLIWSEYVLAEEKKEPSYKKTKKKKIKKTKKTKKKKKF